MQGAPPAAAASVTPDGVDPAFPNARLPPIEIGTALTVTHRVRNHDLAASQRSGGVESMGTAPLLEIIEKACVDCIQPFVEDGYITIGNCVQVRHTAPVPLGSTVQVTVEVSRKLRRTLTFNVTVVQATNTAKAVASGFHQRSYVPLKEIEDKLADKNKARKALAVGLEGSSVHYVGQDNTVGITQGATSQSLVSSAVTTSALMKWSEEACINALEEVLGDGQTTVGGSMLIQHQAPGLRGMVITCKAKLISIDRRKLTFEVIASDRDEVIALATHIRFTVQKAEFERVSNELMDELDRNSDELDGLANIA